MALLTVNDLKIYLGVDTRDTVNDDKYEQSLLWAEAVLYEHRHIGARETITDELHDPATIIIPKLLPIYSVTSLYIDDSLETEDDVYWVYPYLIKIPGLYAGELKTVKITYEGGVASTDTEIDYKNYYYTAKTAILKLAAYDCQKNDTYNGGKDLPLYEIISDIMQQVPGVINI